MEKKWDTVIPVDLKRLFLSGTYVLLVTKGLKDPKVSKMRYCWQEETHEINDSSET
jgi:hypothetical protein